MAIRLGRSVIGNPRLAFGKEWLVTNGLGGYAMGTITGTRTRRYHGLLVASLTPPTRRYLMIAGTDVWIEIQGRRIPLSTHEWGAGVIFPDGYNHLEQFSLDGTMPVFQWSTGLTRIEQRIWMAHGTNTTYTTWQYQRGIGPIRMVVKPLVTYRSHHDITKGGQTITVTTLPSPWDRGLALDILASQYLGNELDASVPVPFRVIASDGAFQSGGDWWWAFHLAEERKRGLNDQEDLYEIGTFVVDLAPGETFAMVSTAETTIPDTWDVALQKEQQRQQALVEAAPFTDAPDWVRQLVLAADQFIVETNEDRQKETYIMGGYPWFGVWGRDTMVSLTGLTSAIGRGHIAADIMQTFARFVDRGMLPNNISDQDGGPAYNAIDATLWFFVAVWAYMREYPDNKELLKSFYPTLTDIIDWHQKGTRYQIREDPGDGLLFGGEYGMQLTWMDAKINDWVVTPRIGKDVEVNALWYNALRIMQDFAERLELSQDAAHYTAEAERVLHSFNTRFWSEKHGYLYDVIDIPNGTNDSSLRPSQLLALSLPFKVLTDPARAKQVVDVCARELLVSYGLRTLGKSDIHYTGHYNGSPQQRDSAYHQGTVWAWLIGPFVSAYLEVYDDPNTARTFIETFADHLTDHGLGTIAEIFDGNPPHRPHGAIAQAWSVSEILRVWRDIERYKETAR